MPGYFGGGGAGGSISAHNQLTGLTADDHPQYDSHKLQRSYGYFGGGGNDGGSTSEAEKYDDVANAWTNKTHLSIAHGGVCAGFSLNGFGYVAGGIAAATTNVTEKYDDVADSWTVKADLNNSRYMCAGFSLNGFGYVAGGDPDTSVTEKYDDVADSWTVKAALASDRYNGAGFSLNNYGYYAGGYIATWTAKVEKYDDVANTWTAKANMGASRDGVGGWSLNAYGYAVGGYVSGTGVTCRTEKYDDVADSWTVKTGMNNKRYRLTHFSLNGYGYAAGGYFNEGANITVLTEKYDDVANTWTNKANMNTSIEGAPGWSQGQFTETKYFDPLIVNTLRSLSYRCIVCGSFNAAATSSGICAVAHGLAAAPVIAWAMPIVTPATNGTKNIDLQGIGGTNISFVAASCPVTTAAPVTSSITVNFVWGAKP